MTNEKKTLYLSLLCIALSCLQDSGSVGGRTATLVLACPTTEAENIYHYQDNKFKTRFFQTKLAPVQLTATVQQRRWTIPASSWAFQRMILLHLRACSQLVATFTRQHVLSHLLYSLEELLSVADFSWNFC